MISSVVVGGFFVGEAPIDLLNISLLLFISKKEFYSKNEIDEAHAYKKYTKENT